MTLCNPSVGCAIGTFCVFPHCAHGAARMAPPERILRDPIAPGVLLDDEPEPQPSRWRLVARWAGALAMVVAAASIMYAEGQRQPAPGVGFGIALGLLMGAALLLGRSNDA
jgi:hypothetical protein